VHAAKDDLDAMLAAAAGDDEHARRMRLRPYGDDDPVA
jgi:hypothetical protein